MTPAAPGPTRIALGQARAIAIAAQGLDRAAHDPAATLERHGFVRTLGGADVYLAARARVRGFRREHLDQLVDRGEAQVVPAVRGCIYLVRAAAVPDALRIADLLSAKRHARDLEKVGIDDDELRRVADAVVEQLESQATGLTTHQLRQRLPDELLRPLGEAGKKVGISSTLPPTLRLLEFERRVERTLENGRLDTERYLWRLAGDSAALGFDTAPETVHQSLARIFLGAAGLATARAFAAWSGLGQGAAKKAFAALESAGLTVEVRVDGEDPPRHLLADRRPWLAPDHEALEAARAATGFLPFGDNLIALHGGPRLLVDAAHHPISVPVWGRGKGTTLGDVHQSTLRPIVAEGRMVGFWELDPTTDEIAWVAFAPISTETRQRLAEEACGLARFLLDEIGHGRSFSIDTEAKMAARVQRIRELGRG